MIPRPKRGSKARVLLSVFLKTYYGYRLKVAEIRFFMAVIQLKIVLRKYK